MLNKEVAGKAAGAFWATMSATAIAIAFYGWFGLSAIFTLLIFVALWVGFYFAVVWAIVYRSAELDKRIPITSNELRRRRKLFYDWLASRGRR